MIDGFVFYSSFYEALRELPNEIRLEAYDAICLYGLEGEEPDCKDVVGAIFRLVKPQIDANNRRREAGRKGGQAPRKQNEANPKQNEATAKQTEAKEKDKVKEKEKDKEKDIEREKRQRFSPPSVDDVREYCNERGDLVDPQTFVDFYTAKGWKVGNNPMKDWRAAVRTWEKRENRNEKVTIKKNPFTRFDQRRYEEDDLETRLLAGVAR